MSSDRVGSRGGLRRKAFFLTVFVCAMSPAYAADIRLSASAAGFSDQQGHYWEARSGFSGGWQGSACSGDIAKTTNDAPYRVNLVNVKSWSRSMPNGYYKVTLALCEPYFNAADQRVFSVAAEGLNQLSNVDIFKAVGKNAALDGSFTVQVKDGRLDLGFSASKNYPLISGIYVAAVPAPNGTVRVSANYHPVVDSQGNVWEAASGFNGGWNWAGSPGDIVGTNDDALYRPEWAGMTGWSRNVPNGNYSVTLKLRESWFGTDGARTFNVSAEGQNKITRLDIHAAAGRNTAYDRSFTVTVTDGVLNLGFSAGVNTPQISAIQVAPAVTPPATALYPIFTKPGNIWTTKLPASAPIAANSADIIARLVRQSSYGDSVNGAPPRAKYTGHWYHYIGTDWQRIWPNIPASTSTKRVLWIDKNGNPIDGNSTNTGFPLQRWIDAVPVPDVPLEQLRSRGGGDKPLVLYQKSSDTVWEFWQLEQQRISRGGDGKNYYAAPNGSVTRADYTTRYAGRLKPASQSNGVYPMTTGSSATSLPYVNGFIMIRDALAGRIDHALTITLPVTGTTTSGPCAFVAPATRCDSSSFLANGRDMRVADGIKEGTLFRLPANFNVEAHAPGNDDRSRFLRMVLTAIRDYGFYLTDTSPTLSLNAEGDAAAKLNSPYYDLRAAQTPAWWGTQGIFWGQNNITFDIPWNQMQVVQPHESRDQL